jgi:hypothetical protein
MSARGLKRLDGLIHGMDLAARIREVMGERTPGEFARLCEVTPASVTFWLSGDTKALKAEPVARMELATGYRASWIVFGKGARKIDQPPETPWRLSEDVRQKVLLLRDEELSRLEDLMRVHLEMPVKTQPKLSLAVNNSQPDSSQARESSYAGKTEAGSGAMDQYGVPEPKKAHGSKKVQRPSRKKGRGGS